MLFVITGQDKENSVDLRKSLRPQHLQYLADAGDRVKLAGPVLSQSEGGDPVGSVIVLDAASEGAVRLFAQNDPYQTGGLFASVTIQPFKAVAGTWPQD